MIEDYLNDTVVEFLAQGGALEADATVSIDGNEGLLDATLIFPGNLVLEVVLVAEMTLAYPAWKSYSFHLRSALGSFLFRYDMSPHHPEIPTFPHHKHVGGDERVVPAGQPTLHQIRNEVIEYLEIDLV